MSNQMWKRGMGTVVVAAGLIGELGCAAVVGLDETYTETEGGIPECGRDGNYEPEGKPLANQVAGDCAAEVCDGAGKTKLVALTSDVKDDGNVCTEDKCDGLIPVHANVGSAFCYSGPAGTVGVGICKGGVQQCDGQGNAVGECQGEVLPGEESCFAGTDEDCDGMINEEGAGCVCGDGFVQPGLGEECDDGNFDSSDLCTAACMNATCGDGFVQAGVGEQCDDGGTADGDNCSPICALQEVLMVKPGASHSCALLSTGKVKCWGDNFLGQLGLSDPFTRGNEPGQMGDNLPAVNLGTARTLTAITTGFHHTCALLNNGTVKCWGYNSSGQLGLGDTNYRGDQSGEMGDNLPAVNVGAGVTVTAIAAGAYHTCALLNNGTMKCWGRNADGQLGLGDINSRGGGPSEMGDNLPSVDLGVGLTAIAIATGAHHSCALLNNGAVKCWGYNGYGELGLGHTNDSGDQPSEMGGNLPSVDLGVGLTASAIAAGHYHTCALLNNGTMKCWGHNGYGQLGLGDKNHRGGQPGEMGSNLLPVNLGAGITVKSIAAGGNHTCAHLNNGTVKCWGYNDFGQLGLEDTAWRGDQGGEMGDNLPLVNLGTGKTAMDIDAGANHTCAILSTGALKCWGYNAFGQLGLGDTMNRGDQPGQMGDKLPTVKLFSDLW